jgi:Tfp pilus assembly protein PilV
MNDIRKLTNWSKDAKGDTIIEVLMAICILAVGILAVVTMQTVSLKGNTTSSNITDGVVVAMDQIEKLMERSWDHSDLDSASGAAAHDETSPLEAYCELNNAHNTHQVTQGQHTIKWDITDDDVISDTKTINMTVTWWTWGRNSRVSVQQVIPRII